MVAFSTAVDTYAAGMRPASEAPQALTWAEKISAGGTTDINSALLEAASMADNERPTYVIFLTDCLPTVGETDSQKIIDNQPVLGCTGGALWSDVTRPGPIYLQGDHTSIEYRNIALMPVLK